ncbi:MAG: hypothetical protein ACM3MJ_03490 [Deltaproteobacteria bacterium]
MKVLIADQRLVTEVFPMEEAIPTTRAALSGLGTWVEIGGLHFGKAVEV